MKATAIIEISAFDECCDRACQTVRENVAHIENVQVIYKSGSPPSPERFNVAPLPLDIQPRIEYKMCQPILLFVPPDCHASSDAIVSLYDRAAKSSLMEFKFAASSVTILDGISIWNAFYLLATVWWALHNLFEFGKLHRPCDLRLEYLIRKGAQITRPPSHRFWWRIRNEIHARAITSESSMVRRDVNGGHWEYLHRALHTHPSFRRGLWITVYGLIWLTVFAALRSSWLYIQLALGIAGVVEPSTFSKVLMGSQLIVIWGVLPIIYFIFGPRYVSMEWWPLYYVSQPFAILAFPAVVLYARFYNSKKHWH